LDTTFIYRQNIFIMLNGDIETDFQLDESSEATLQIRHDGEINRTKITAQDISSTSFAAKLNHVQYGKWSGQDAVLLKFSFEFRFQNESIKRFTAASIRITLQETKDATLSEPSPRNPKNDPHIARIAPVQVCGELKKESKSRHWQISVPVKYTGFGVEAGGEGEVGVDTVADVDHRMWINGFTDGDDEHHDDNIAVWETQENAVQDSGILHRFPAALVAILPKGPKHLIKLTGQVTPTIAFSLNPLRLRQKKDDPVFLDRETQKGDPIAPDLDFKSPEFPWDEVVKIPSEYSVGQSKRSLTTLI
jgi:hypothetical protein